MIPANTAQYSLAPSTTSSSKGVEKEVLINNIAKHPTPEGLLLTLMPAGLLPRLWAWLIDLLIRAIIIIVIGIIGSFFGEAGSGIIAITYFIITWLYPVYFEVYRSGMTPGKKKQGIYVCHDDGTPISLQSSMIRNLLRVADFLPFAFAAGILTMMFTQRSQRLGDIIAGTLVVYKQQDNLEKLYKSVYGFNFNQLNAQVSNSNPITAQDTRFDPASALFFYPLRLNEQQALVAYKERLAFLSTARQQEIAYALAPLVTLFGHTAQTVQAKNAAVQQAVLQKAMMIQGQPISINSNKDSNSPITSNSSSHSMDAAKINTKSWDDH